MYNITNKNFYSFLQSNIMFTERWGGGLYGLHNSRIEQKIARLGRNMYIYIYILLLAADYYYCVSAVP